MADNYILTPEGKQQLEEELHYLETEKRAEVGERIKVAREFGDISENSEYDDAKNEQGMLEARIAEITRILGEATVVATPKRPTPCTSAPPSPSTWAAVSACSPSWRCRGRQPCRQDFQRVPGGRCAAGPQEGRDEIETTGPTGRVIKMKIVNIEH